MNIDIDRRKELFARHFGHIVGKALLATLAVVALAAPTLTEATVIPYDIVVTVTAAPNAPGSFPSNQWNFPNLPAQYRGTFDADDATVGAIGNLMLTIGGLDIAVTNPDVALNVFDPGTLLLDYMAYDPTQSESVVSFGDLGGGGAPSNYAVALQNNQVPPTDPYYGFSQNWVGTVAITSASSVPEPATLTLLGVALAGLGFARRRNLH